MEGRVSRPFWSLGDNPAEPPDGTFAAPPSASFLELPATAPRERRASGGSCDGRRGGSPDGRRRSQRHHSAVHDLEDLDVNEAEVTLLSFARDVRATYRRVASAVGRAARKLLFKPKRRQPKVVCEADVMDQVRWICKDYIINRLASRDLMSRKIGFVPQHWSLSRHVIAAGCLLESLYPRTYSNVSRKLSLTMGSVKLVRNCLTAFLKVLFEGNITWAKIVSMFSVAGLFAEECSSQGHADFVPEVVDTVVDFSRVHLLSWLVAQGGWESFPLPESYEGARVSKLGLLVLTGGAAAAITGYVYCTE